MSFLYYLVTFGFASSLELPKNFSVDPAHCKRPQEPIRPYPYVEEEVIFENASASVLLSGTLTIPQGKGPFPVVVLVHGSGALDRDLAICGHKPFLVWADHFTRQGIAVLRFDKRGVKKSTGNFNLATLEDFASDALAAIDFLKTRKEICPKKIGLLGISEGGMTVSLAASKSKDVAFVISMAGPAENFEKLINTQVQELQETDEVPAEITIATHAMVKQIFEVLTKEKDLKKAEEQLREVLTNGFNRVAESQREVIAGYYGGIEQQIQLFNSMWFRYAMTYEPTVAFKALKIPVLAINGSLDKQVSSQQNLPLIAQALEEAGNKDYTILELTKLNHAFQTCQTGSVKEYAKIEETIAPSVLELITEWILKRTSQK